MTVKSMATMKIMIWCIVFVVIAFPPPPSSSTFLVVLLSFVSVVPPSRSHIVVVDDVVVVMVCAAFATPQSPPPSSSLSLLLLQLFIIDEEKARNFAAFSSANRTIFSLSNGIGVNIAVTSRRLLAIRCVSTSFLRTLLVCRVILCSSIDDDDDFL